MSRARKVPVVLTDSEVKKLFATAIKESKTEDAHKRFNAIRDEAIIRLMYSTGLRAGEICNLNLDGVWLNEKQLKIVNGKGGNEEYQPIRNALTLVSLERYLELRGQIVVSRAFFINWRGHRYLPRQLNRDLKALALKASILKNVSPHTLRHTFATELLRRTGNLRIVQVGLRHKQIQTTEIYTRIVKTDLEKALDEAGI